MEGFSDIKTYYSVYSMTSASISRDFWITYWDEEDGFKKITIQEDNLIYDRYKLFLGPIFASIAVKDLAKGIYEMGLFLGSEDRDFLVIY
jgi:hypothetical protein